MANEKNIKQVSRLTGALLARKGAAAPSSPAAIMNQQAINRFAPLQQEVVEKVDSSLDLVPEKPYKQKNRSLEKGIVSTKKINQNKSSHKASANPRIAMTLRMEEDIHLRLRIFSAHTRKSCQVILSEALELYLAENNDEVYSQRMASQNG
ncbi:MAG: hypothetical protein K9G26_05730 [Emcibacter sp.]|nr:hypothetical protein [Emcibacter sp.]